jgi:hypothetical protein
MTVAPSFSSSFLPAIIVPPVAIRSSISNTRLPRVDRIGMQLDGGAAVLELVGLLDGREGQLALLADRHETDVELVGHHRAQDEAARVQAGHHVGRMSASM